MKINIKKTKALRVNTNKKEPFMLGDESIEDVESFVYLGSEVTKDGGDPRRTWHKESKKQMVFLYNSTQYGETTMYLLGPNCAYFVAM